MKRMNLGCGSDIKEGWLNVDSKYTPKYEKGKMEIWDARGGPQWNYTDFDFILVNHVLCTMPYDDVRKVLANCYEMLKLGGTLQVIDTDVRKAIDDWQNNHADNLPIEDGSPDWKLCMHLTGFSTRPSLFTSNVLFSLLIDAGFQPENIWNAQASEYDSRPLESLVVEARK